MCVLCVVSVQLALEKEELRIHLQASKDAQRQLTAEVLRSFLCQTVNTSLFIMYEWSPELDQFQIKLNPRMFRFRFAFATASVKNLTLFLYPLACYSNSHYALQY